MITEGYEHRMYFKLVSLGLPKGVGFVSEDTVRRSKYIRDNPNFPNNIVLISCMTYCENILNDSDSNSNKWITDFGGNFVDTLFSMKIIRNSWTHNNGDISKNNTFRGMDGAQQYEYVKSTLQSTASDSNSYDFSDDSTTVNVLPPGCDRICAICTKIFINADLIQLSEDSS